jgi:putative ABC transport system permease protein
VYIYTNRALRAEVLRIFDSTFAITYALELIAILVAVLGVAATLLTLVLERRRDLAILRSLGADRRQARCDAWWCSKPSFSEGFRKRLVWRSD